MENSKTSKTKKANSSSNTKKEPLKSSVKTTAKKNEKEALKIEKVEKVTKVKTETKTVKPTTVKEKTRVDTVKLNATEKTVKKAESKATNVSKVEKVRTETKVSQGVETNKETKPNKKPNKIKLIIISVVLAVVLLGGGLLTFFLIRAKDNYDLLGFLNGVGSQIENNHSKLAGSFNNKQNSGEVFLSIKNNGGTNSLGKVNNTLTENSQDVWQVVENTNTFDFFVAHINNVMGYYAISEYLVENLSNRDFNKTYHYKSSVIEYYAKAEKNANFFKLVLHNDLEDIDVIVNRNKETNKASSIEFIQLNTKDDVNFYLYTKIDLDKNTYTQINLTSSIEFPKEITDSYIENNVSVFEYYFVEYSDISTFKGTKKVRNNTGGNSPQSTVLSNNGNGNRNNHTKDIDDKINSFGKSKIQNIKKRNFGKIQNMAEFPRPEDLHAYAFSKYSVTLEEGVNGKKFLATKQRGGVNQDVLRVLTNFSSIISDDNLHTNFNLINYNVGNKNIKKTIAEFMPEISSYLQSIKNWLNSSSYNKKTFYYKAISISNSEKVLLGNDRIIYELKQDDSVTYVNVVANENNFIIEHLTIGEENSTQNYITYFDYNLENISHKSIEIRKYNYDLTFSTLKNSQTKIEEESFNCESLEKLKFTFEVNTQNNQPNFVEYLYADSESSNRTNFVGTILKYANSSIITKEDVSLNYATLMLPYYVLSDKIENNTIISSTENEGFNFIQADELFEVYSFEGAIYSWQYKQGYTVVSQKFNNNLLDVSARSLKLSDYNTPNERNIEFVVEKDGKKYVYSCFTIISGGGDIGSGGSIGGGSLTVNEETFTINLNGLFVQQFTIQANQIKSINFQAISIENEDLNKTSRIETSETEVETYITNEFTVDSSTREFDCSYGNYVIKVVYINSFGNMMERTITVTYENIA